METDIPNPQSETQEPDFSLLESVVPEENPAPDGSLPPQENKPRKQIRPEAIMGIIALLAAGLLLTMIVVCLPYFSPPSEDPDLLPQRHNATQPTHAPTEPTQAVTEPTLEPTIPPDPNPYGRLDFQYNRNNYLYCLEADSYAGVDVSAFQGDIDWEAVKASGIDFAMIRLGYRGYGQAGRLVEDEFAQKNLKEATEAGIPIGVYFFSQALSIDEVNDEIIFMLEILGDYRLDMPIVLDWEIPGVENPRTKNMDARTLTDCMLHFCQTMEELGFQPMVYFNWYQSEHLLYLTELEDYPFWLALYQDRMVYPWKIEMWQYTDSGRVPGINGNVDINVYIPE